MKIIADNNIPFLHGRIASGCEVTYVDQWGFTPENVKDADALMIRTRTRCNEALLSGSNVRMIATATIGMDQIDIPWCEAHGIRVANAPGCNAPGVAQYVWSALLRMGFDPARHTLGIVGCGNVGGVVAEWGARLGAKILVSDPPKEVRGERLEVREWGKSRVEGRESRDNYTFEYAPLERILRECDAVTLHTPLTKDGEFPTYHLIGEDELSLLKPGAIFINAARGPVVDFQALKPVVMQGKIRAAIDTWEGEPAVDPELLGAVEYGTFHIAGYSLEGKQRATRMALEAISEGLGIAVNTEGLTGPYAGSEGLTREAILNSYDPAVDTAMLRNAPEEFDTLRKNYNYRKEV